MIGKIHSIQSLGTVDGPGVRFVVFLKGCNLRCACCHNPDTWTFDGSKEFTAQEIISKAVRFREYFGEKGGITVSGGEPLLQADFCRELFEMAHEENVNTCLDTSGSVINKEVLALLKVTDRVLLDIKYTNNEDYLRYAGCTLASVLEFLEILNEMKIPTTLRQVVIPTKNDDEENFKSLKNIKEKFSCVDKIELLPFKKICQVKYDNLGIDFPFKDVPEPKNMESYQQNLL